jgi:hypothetical protein
MGSSISQVQAPQGNQPVNPQYSQANYSPAQQQMGGKFGPVAQMAKDVTDRAAPQFPVAHQAFPVGAPMPREDELAQMNAPLPARAPMMQQDQSSGKGARRVMYSPTSNQPTMGQPNPYPNTVGQWDNASIQPRSYGKGKGG